jgi:hypothetical protein
VFSPSSELAKLPTAIDEVEILSLHDGNESRIAYEVVRFPGGGFDA